MILNTKRLNSRKVTLLILLIIILIVLFINIDKILTFAKSVYKSLFLKKHNNTVVVSNNIESFENINNNLEESFGSYVDLPTLKNVDLELEIIKDTNSIKVSFPTIDLTSKPEFILKGYILALAKYDYNLVKQDEVSINVSNEYNDYSIEINNIIDNSSITSTELKTTYKNYKNYNNFSDSINIDTNLQSLNDLEKENYKYFVAKYFVESGRDSLYNIIYNYISDSLPSGLINSVEANEDNANIIISNFESKTNLSNNSKKLLIICKDIAQNESKTSICNDSGNCSYEFKNLDVLDNNNNLYFYKLGVAAILTGISESETDLEHETHVTPFTTFTLEGKHFISIDKGIEEQRELLQKLKDLEKSSSYKFIETQQQDVDKLDTNEYLNAYIEMLKPHVGNYPDEFTLTPEQIKEHSLQNYLNKSFSKGQININLLTN